jgi:hypothetical protein
MRDLPDLNVNYREGSFDKDVGYCATDFTIEQTGERVRIHKVYTENEQEVSSGTLTGVITKIYAAEGLAQITLDDGERYYFDLAARKLRWNVEHLSDWFELPHFDVRDTEQLALLIRWMNRIARALEPAFEINFPETSSINWGEPYNPFAAQGYTQQRMRDAALGATDGFHCQLTLTEELDQSSAAFRFSRLLLKAGGLPAGMSVALFINSYGRHSLSVQSPIEKQAAVLETIKRCLPAKPL